MPTLHHIANLWTLWDYPSAENEWPLEQKLEAIKQAGFDGVCWGPLPGLRDACERLGLIFVGGLASSDAAAFPTLLRELKDAGAEHVNVQLGRDAMLTPEALLLTSRLFSVANDLHLKPAIETHRGTCTETPEKMYALADAYQHVTGELLPISFDFSHFAVVKHLLPEEFSERLLVRPDLIQNAQQFHFRPFNGHHVQVAITDSEGELTREVKEWIPFAEDVLRCWLGSEANRERDLFICPELGPKRGGYALSTFPDSWADAQRLRMVIADLWAHVTA